MNIINFSKNKLIINIVIFILSLIVYHAVYGIHTLLPQNVSWLLDARHDWGQHYLGWLFFRNDTWTFPIGTISNWYYPMGTNIGFTDSIPLFALIFKIINPILGDNFQYFGIWFFLCFYLAGFFTHKILDIFKINFLIQIIIILFVITNPVLLYRGLHPALCAHWLIIASIYLYIISPKSIKSIYNISIYQGLLVFLSSLIHPYITFIIIGFTVITPLKNNILFFKSNILKNIIIFIATFALLLISWFIIGLIGGSVNSGMDNNEYGIMGWNLNSFYNSFGYSTFIPKLPLYLTGQYEGYSYLGIGMMFIIILALGLTINNLIKRRYNKKLLINLLILSLWLVPLTFFGVSNWITFNEKLLFKYPVPELISSLGNIFRATSRFIWLAYYLLFIGALVVIAKLKIKKEIKIFGLTTLLLIQIYDIKLFFFTRNLKPGPYQSDILTEDKWNILFKEFDHIITYPIYDKQIVSTMDYQDLSNLAAHNKSTITSAYVARADFKGEANFHKLFLDDIINSRIDENVLYIVGENNLDSFSIILNSGKAQIKKIDNYFAIYSINKNINIEQTESEKLLIENLLLSKSKSNQFIKTNLLIIPNENIKSHFEKLNINKNYIDVSGWALLKSDNNNSKDSIFIILNDLKNIYIAQLKNYPRNDVAKHFEIDDNRNIGFQNFILTDNFEKNTKVEYGILIKSNGRNNYMKKGNVIINEIDVYEPISTDYKQSDDNILYNIESITVNNNEAIISGWMISPDINNENSQKELILKKDNKYYKFNTNDLKREDVVQYFKTINNIQNSGFKSKINLQSFDKGKYQIGIRLISHDSIYLSKMTDKEIIIN